MKLGWLATALTIVATSCSVSGHISVTHGAASPAARGATAGAPAPSPVLPPVEPVVDRSDLSGVSVTPAEAGRVGDRLWRLRVQARHDRDVAGLKVIEAGQLLEADIGYICLYGCIGPVLTPGDLTVNVPRQTSWPATFFATETYTVGCLAAVTPCANSLVAQQDSVGAPWRLVFLVAYSGSNFAADPTPSPDGFGQQPSADTRRLGALPSEYASYLGALKHTGSPPAPTRLAPGPFTTALGASLFDPPSAQQARGETSTAAYRTDAADRVWQFAASHGTTTVCGTVRYRVDVRPIGGGPLTQPQDGSRFGPMAPGSYPAVLLSGLHMACFEAHPDSAAPINVIGTWGDVTTAVVPALS
jgi:hypothetical protein